MTTDVGDKFLKQAAGQINSITELGEENIDSFPQDVDALGILRLDRMPRAPYALMESVHSSANWMGAKNRSRTGRSLSRSF